MRRINPFSIGYLLIFVLFSCEPTTRKLETAQNSTILSNLTKEEIEKGMHLFKLQCARCHGISGNGGNAPSLKRLQLPHAPDDASLMTIIQYGIPGTEMPGTWLLTPPDVRLVAGYVRSLGQVEQTPISGDIATGKIVYEEKGACKLCHIQNGEGGSLGPDLNRVGAKRSAEFIRQVLLTPGFYKKEGEMANSANGFIQHLIYTIKTKAGNTLTAMRVNEDAFTIQFRDAQNRFYSFRKRDILEMEKQYEASLMPSVKEVLTTKELDDLVAYLVSLQ